MLVRLYYCCADVFPLILERCSYRDLIRLGRICRQMRQVMNSLRNWQHLWRSSLSRNLPVVTDELLKSKYLWEMHKITILPMDKSLIHIIQHDYIRILEKIDFKALPLLDQIFVLTQATRWGRSALVKAVFPLLKLDQCTLDVLLMKASVQQYVDLIKFYLRRGAQVSSFNYAALRHGMSLGDRELTELLVASPLPSEWKDQLYSLTQGNVDALRILKECGFVLTSTVLEELVKTAMQDDRVDTLEYLLQTCDCVTVCSKYLWISISSGCSRVLLLLRQRGDLTVDKLSQCKFRDDLTALEYVIEKGWTVMFRLLLPYFPLFSPADRDGRWLFLCFENRRFDMLPILLQYPLPVELMDRFVIKVNRYRLWSLTKPMLPEEQQLKYTDTYVESLMPQPMPTPPIPWQDRAYQGEQPKDDGRWWNIRSCD